MCVKEMEGFYRQKHYLEDTWIYALCRDKSNQICCYVLDLSSKQSWKLIRDIPPQCSKKKGISFEVLGKRFYLLGGCGWFQDARDEVYCYDASKNSWDTNVAMSTARCYFACEALNKKIYAIGTIGSNSSDPLSWDTYDPCTNSWTSYSDPNIVADIEDFVVMDGKIYICYGASFTVPTHIYSVVYDPSNGTWQAGPCAVVDDTLCTG